jgi:NADH:ubiquinone oxidoreductase subunit 3 (subunit A)
MNDYLMVALFGFAGLLYGGGALIVSRLLAPKGPDQGRKYEAYESGEANIGQARIQFKLGYYLFALVFLVFDVEAVFLVPVLGVFRPAVQGKIPGVTAWIAWIETAAFVAVLVLALYYARRKKALEWN